MSMKGNSAATLAEGERVEQSFNKCDINVAGGDVVHGDKIITNIYNIHSTNSASMHQGMPDSQKDISRLETELRKIPLSVSKWTLLLELKNLKGSADLYTSLLLAECGVFLNHGQEDGLEELQTLRKLCRGSPLQDVECLAKSLGEREQPLAAVIMYSISGELRSNGTPNDVIRRITEHVIAIRRVTKHLEEDSKLWVIVLQYALRHMLALLSTFKSVVGADYIVKAVNEAMCLANIASLQGESDDTFSAHETCQKGLALLTERLGENAHKYKCYSWLLNNLGTAFLHSGEYAKGIEYCENSIRATEKAEDYEDEESRRGDRERASRNLEKAREKLNQNPEKSENRKMVAVESCLIL